MSWYWIVLIVVGCILAGYITGLLFYVINAKDCDGVNLLTCKDHTVQTEHGELNVDASRDNLFAFATVAGIFFPGTILVYLMVMLMTAIKWMLSPITKFIIDKNK